MTAKKVPSQARQVFLNLIGRRIIDLQLKERKRTVGDPVASLELSLDSGAVVGIEGNIALNSVVLWLESGPGGAPQLPAPATGLQTTEAASSFAPQNYLGTRIGGLETIRRKMGGTLKNLPNEVGLLIRAGGKGDFIAGLGLLDDPKRFDVLLPAQIPPEIQLSLIGL